MAVYEVVLAIYRKDRLVRGSDEPVQEETLLETDDWDEAEELFDSLLSDDADEEEDAPEEGEEEEEEVPE